MATDHRKQLLDRLRAYFYDGADAPDFDEYELVEAFDYAGDKADNDLQDHIIEYALRRYPDFPPLIIRKALNMLDDGQRSDAIAVAAQVKADFPLREVFDLLLAIDDGLDSAEAIRRLEKIVKSHEKFNDEEMLRVMNTAIDLDGGYEWLADHVKALCEHTDYASLVYFEMTQFARDRGLFDAAIAYAEEMSQLEPFEVEYHEILTELYIAKNDAEGAATALEYALALNPESARTRMLMAHVSYMRGGNPVEAYKAIDDVIMTYELQELPITAAVVDMTESGHTDEARELLLRYIERFPMSVTAIDYLLVNCPKDPRVREILDHYYANNPEENSEYFWNAWAQHHFGLHNYAGVITVFSVYRAHAPLTQPLILLQSLYFENDPGEIIRLLTSADELMGCLQYNGAAHDAREAATNRPLCMLLLVMSLIRTNNEQLAMALIESEIDGLTNYMASTDLMGNMMICGYGDTLRKIRTGLRRGTYPDKYDPLLMPQNLLKKK